MIINKEKVMELCFAFYNQGVSDGDYGAIHKFADVSKDRYKNDFDIFKEYVTRKRIFNIPQSNVLRVNSDLCSDKLWVNAWMEDELLDSIISKTND